MAESDSPSTEQESNLTQASNVGGADDSERRLRRLISAATSSGFIYAITGLLLSLLVGSIIIAAFGVNPREAMDVALEGSLTTRSGLADTLVFATPRLLIALGAAIAIRSGVFNLGGEGQLQMGAVGATLIAVFVGPVIAPLHILLVIVGAALAGAAYAGIAAVLQNRRGADALITTLLLNSIAVFFVLYLVQGPLQQDGSSFNQSDRILESAELPMILPDTRLHFGFLIALLGVAATAILLHRTTLGIEMRAAGFNSRAARLLGLSPRRLILIAMLISGAFGGVAGGLEVTGVQFRLLQGFAVGVGFEGVAIAFLGALKPIPILVTSILFGALHAGVIQLQRLGVPGSMSLIVAGLPILVLAVGSGLALWRQKGT